MRPAGETGSVQQRVTADVPPPPRHLGSQLCELEKLIDKMMVEDFSMYARGDLSRSLREEPQVLEKVWPRLPERPRPRCWGHR